MKTYQVYYECPIQVIVRVKAKSESEAQGIAEKRAEWRFSTLAGTLKQAKQAGDVRRTKTEFVMGNSRYEKHQRLVERRLNERTSR